MDDNELKTHFQVSSEEAEAIDSAAREAGLSRSDYIRQQLLNPQQDLEARRKPGDPRPYHPSVPNPLRHRPAP